MTKTKKPGTRKAASKAKPNGKLSQPELPGVGRKRDKELDSMILALHRTRTKRIKLLADEIDMANALIEKMKAKKKKSYVCIDGDLKYPCMLTAGKEKVSVKCEEA